MTRFFMVLRYGWRHANLLAEKHGEQRSKRWPIYWDIIRCYLRYRMFSNVYFNRDFYYLDKARREELGAAVRQDRIKKDRWVKKFNQDWRFLSKYSNIKYHSSLRRREKRKRAYQKRYHTGENLALGYGVILSRKHYLDGELQIGHGVNLGTNVFIDYTGGVVLQDGVSLSERTMIYSHKHLFRFANNHTPTLAKVVIGKGAWIGAGCIIMPGVTVGEGATVTAGSVVTKNVPPHTVASGNPAAVVADMQGIFRASKEKKSGGTTI